jgi:hypothetical protein
MLFLQLSEGLAKRLSGPGGFRFIIQPTVAVALGIRDGLQDAKAGEPPYLIGIIFHPEHRQELWAKTIQNILKPFIIGVVLDLIFQYFIFQRARLIPAVIVGLLLIGLPYALARGITNRMVARWHRRDRVGS